MPYDEPQARQQLLDGLAQATDQLAQALASLGGAYEQLDEQQADRVEEQLFHPVQRAYARARRTHTEFARRYALSPREFTLPEPGLPSTGVKGFIQHALDSVERAELELVGLQESAFAIEVGDVELRAGLSEVRRLITEFPKHARAFVSSFGR